MYTVGFVLTVRMILIRSGLRNEVDIVSDFVSDTVSGIADGVHGMLNFAAWTVRRSSARMGPVVGFK